VGSRLAWMPWLVSRGIHRAYAQVPLTTARHATHPDGNVPRSFKVNDSGVPPADDLPTLPTSCGSADIELQHFVGSLILDPEAKSAPGFERG